MKTKFKMQERGITLIALIISIIIMIILAAITIKIVYDTRMIEIAVDGAKDYADEAKKEQEVFDELDKFINVVKNRRPILTVNVKEMKPTELTIEAKATDQDGGNLKYILYFGTDKDNLEAKEEKEAEQGIAVEWNLTGLSPAVKYYYRVEVKDEYETVTSEIMEVITRENKVPVITKTEVTDKQTNSVTIKAMATDEDGDRLIYKLYFGTDSNNLSQKAVSEEVEQGTEVNLTTTEYDINKIYYYRIDVTDGIVTTMGETKEIKKNSAPVIKKLEIGSRQANSITVKAQATDEDSDKLIYKLYMGTTNSTLTQRVTSNAMEQGIEVSLTWTQYNINTTYYYRVDVTDGKITTTGSVKSIFPIEIGGYVSYIPTQNTYSKVTNNATYTGNTRNKADFSTESFPWRIWSMDSTTLTLIADGVTKSGGNGGRLELSGSVGYNNAVTILNDICYTCYSNNSIGAEGRSLNIEDIENVLNTKWKPTDCVITIAGKNYYTYSGKYKYTENRNYPYLYSLEEYSNIDGRVKNKGQSGSITRSQTAVGNTKPIAYRTYYPSNLYSSNKANTYIELTKTEWSNENLSIDNFKNSKYYYMIFKNGNTEQNLVSNIRI